VPSMTASANFSLRVTSPKLNNGSFPAMKSASDREKWGEYSKGGLGVLVPTNCLYHNFSSLKHNVKRLLFLAAVRIKSHNPSTRAHVSCCSSLFEVEAWSPPESKKRTSGLESD
jgi:hypothetical protein